MTLKAEARYEIVLKAPINQPWVTWWFTYYNFVHVISSSVAVDNISADIVHHAVRPGSRPL